MVSLTTAILSICHLNYCYLLFTLIVL